MSEDYLDPIIVTGCARSGTSLVAGILERCGAFGGKTCGPTKANPRGQYENRPIIEGVEKPYLQAIGVDPMGQYPLPDYDDLSDDPGRRETTLKIMIEQGLQPGQRWYFKDAKAALDWPIWQRAFPDANWVIVRRNKDDIVRSCERTTFMRKRNDWGRWVDFHLTRFTDILRTGNAYEIWPQAMTEGDYNGVRNVVESLGLVFDETAATSFVEPALYHRSA